MSVRLECIAGLDCQLSVSENPDGCANTNSEFETTILRESIPIETEAEISKNDKIDANNDSCNVGSKNSEHGSGSLSSDQNEQDPSRSGIECCSQNTCSSMKDCRAIEKSGVPLHERLGITVTQLNSLRNMAIEYYFGAVVVKKIKIERKYECSVCMKVLRNNTNLKRHMQCHNPVKAYNCEICGKDFSDKYYFKLHYKRHSGNFPYQCGICQRPFLQKCTLDEHLRRHTGERPYKCQYCDKTFSTNGIMLEHQRTHTGEKPYKCKLCEKAFTQGNTLRQHMSVHSNEMDQVNCGLCGKTFSCKSYLKIHMKVHQKGEPLYCGVCQKMFNCPRSLTRHMRVHTGEKPFKCAICGRQFSQKSNLYKHRKVHRDKPVEMENDKGNDAQTSNEDVLINSNWESPGSHIDVMKQEQNGIKQEQNDMPKKKNTLFSQVPSVSDSQNEKTDENVGALEYTTIKIKQEPYAGDIGNDSIHDQDSSHGELNDIPLKTNQNKDNFSPNGIHKNHVKVNNKKENDINFEKQIMEPLLCQICNIAFYKSEHMENHMKFHEANYFKKLFVCKVCFQSFPNKLTMTAHAKCHKTPESSNRTCNICQENFTTKRQLTTHRNKMHPLKIMAKKLVEQRQAKSLMNDTNENIAMNDTDECLDNDKLLEGEKPPEQVHETTNTGNVVIQATLDTKSQPVPWDVSVLDIRIKNVVSISKTGTKDRSDDVNQKIVLGDIEAPSMASLHSPTKMNKLEELLKTPLSAFPKFPKFD